MNNEFNYTNPKLVSVLHWQEKISFLQPPRLEYGRSDTRYAALAREAPMVPINVVRRLGTAPSDR